MKEDGEKEYIKMNKIDLSDKIDQIWNEIIIKEQLENIIKLLTEIKENQSKIQELNIQENVKEELTKLWNISEVPNFKMILEKIDLLENKDKQKQKIEERIARSGVNKETIDLIKLEEKPGIVPIDAWRRTKEPIMIDISKMKPQLTEPVKQTIEKLALLSKRGKF